MVRPFVYRGYARHWEATRNWNLAYLIRQCGDISLPIYDSLDQSVTLREFSKLKHKPYLRGIFLRQYLPQLMQDVQTPEFAEPNFLSHPEVRRRIPELWNPWFEFFLSAPGTRFPYIHQDAHGTHAWVHQVHGTKRFWIWPPDANLESARFDVSEGQVIESAFPRSMPIVLNLKFGDVLFLPSDWWHTTETQSFSITLSGNFVNEINKARFLQSYFPHEVTEIGKRSASVDNTFASMNSH